MQLNTVETLITIAAIALGNMLTRFLPFLLFPDHHRPPDTIRYLGRTLPPAMMGLLIIYCLRDVSFVSMPYGIPELLSITVIVVLHSWKRNVLLSISVGTALYMLLLHLF